MTDNPTETWTVGDVTVTRVAEMELPSPPELLLPDATADLIREHRAQLGTHATDDGWIVVSIHGFVLDDGTTRILVDGGVGNGKSRPSPFFDQLNTGFLDALTAAGHPPETIDVVVATHLHPDHVGWFTQPDRDRWVPTFPNARHLIVADENDHWTAHANVDRDGDYMTDSIAPVQARGLIDLVRSDHLISGTVRLTPTPGHSPHHVSVVIDSKGAQAVITGDLLHHPVQLPCPDLVCIFDEDPDEAIATRRAFLDRYADTGTLILGTHFGTPAGIEISSSNTAWSFSPRPGTLNR